METIKEIKTNRLEPREEQVNAVEPTREIQLMTKFSPVPYAKSLEQTNNFIYDNYKRFWRYDKKEGVWREDAEMFIKNKLRNELMGEEQQKKYYTDEVVSYLRDKNYKPEFNAELNPNIIPFNNCIFNLETEQTEPFNESYFILNKLPIDLKEGECPVIDKFFDDCIGNELKPILYDLAAYCLFRRQSYQKLFFIYGSEETGKSTYNELLRRFLGKDNVSSISPHDITDNKFALGIMWDKSANISSDLSYDSLRNVNKLKELTGEDTITVERKYKEGFPCKIYAKQIYSTNQLPNVQDKTKAWYRRVYPVKFGNNISKDQKDPFLMDKLTSEEELTGFAWQCVKQLIKLKNRKFVFTFDVDKDKVAELYEDEANPINKFIREFTEQDSEGHIFKYEFKEKFLAWLKDNKLRIWTDTEIGLFMKSLGIEDGKRNFYGGDSIEPKRYNAWLNIKFKGMSNQSNVSTTLLTSIYNIEKVSKPMVTQDSMDRNTYFCLKDIPSFILTDGKEEPAHKSEEIIKLEPETAKILISDNSIERKWK